jgi:hypothetical protein
LLVIGVILIDFRISSFVLEIDSAAEFIEVARSIVVRLARVNVLRVQIFMYEIQAHKHLIDIEQRVSGALWVHWSHASCPNIISRGQNVINFVTRFETEIFNAPVNFLADIAVGFVHIAVVEIDLVGRLADVTVLIHGGNHVDVRLR